MGVPSNMALKAILILATISSACSQTQSHCSAYEDGTNDGRDCSCADRFYSQCMEPSTDSQLPVDTLEECQSLCSVWSGCEWFIFPTQGEHLNCKMFSTGQVSMADYLRSCYQVGGALRNEDDSCLGDFGVAQDLICSNANFCPGGCSSCAGDRCNGFAETECTTLSQDYSIPLTLPDVLSCQIAATTAGDLNYFIFDQYEEVCKGNESGDRRCYNVVAAKNLDIQSCQTGTQRLH